MEKRWFWLMGVRLFWKTTTQAFLRTYFQPSDKINVIVDVYFFPEVTSPAHSKNSSFVFCFQYPPALLRLDLYKQRVICKCPHEWISRDRNLRERDVLLTLRIPDIFRLDPARICIAVVRTDSGDAILRLTCIFAIIRDGV